MKLESPTRHYNMSARVEAAAQTERNILVAAAELWREKALDEITLHEIAQRAGVTVQTVIRRFGSKEGLAEACIAADVTGARADHSRSYLFVTWESGGNIPPVLGVARRALSPRRRSACWPKRGPTSWSQI